MSFNWLDIMQTRLAVQKYFMEIEDKEIINKEKDHLNTPEKENDDGDGTLDISN